MTTVADLHRVFAARDGAEQIASAFAMAGVQRWLRRRRPRVVCEIGGGIGALSSAILQALPPGASYTIVEPDPWCRERLAEQFAPWIAARSILVVPEFERPARPINLLVVDGGNTCPEYYVHLAHRAVVFWEGRRRPQRAVFRGVCARPYCEAEWKPPDRSKGYAVAQLDPTAAERLWFGSVRLRQWAADERARSRGHPVGKRRRA